MKNLPEEKQNESLSNFISNPPTTENSPQAEIKTKHFSNVGMARKTIVLIVVLAVAALGLTLLAIPSQNKPKPVAQLPKVTPNPLQTVLTISSAPVPLIASQSSFKTDVIINTGQNKVTAVQLELAYDPKVLGQVDINPGAFFIDPTVVIKKIDEKEGRISFALKISPNQSGVLGGGVLGQGILAVINFKVEPSQKQTPTSILFLPKTEVSSQDLPGSTLKSTINAGFSLRNFITPTPTLTPTPIASTSAH